MTTYNGAALFAGSSSLAASGTVRLSAGTLSFSLGVTAYFPVAWKLVGAQALLAGEGAALCDARRSSFFVTLSGSSELGVDTTNYAAAIALLEGAGTQSLASFIHYRASGALFSGAGKWLPKLNANTLIGAVLNGRGYWWPYIAEHWETGAVLNGGGGFDVVPVTAYILAPTWPAATIPAFRGSGSLTCEAQALYLFTDPVNPGILKDAGSQVLYQNASGLEKALADTDAYRLTATYAELVRDQWDPVAISAENLPYLAWGVGVNLWEDVWDDAVRRGWVADQWSYKAVRGTPAAYRLALANSGYTVTQMVRPPQGFWLAPDLTKAEWDYWIRQMPELRIYYGPKQGVRGDDDFFLDGPDDGTVQRAYTGYADVDFLPLDDGFALYGRYTLIRQNGIDTPAFRIEYNPASETLPSVEYERVSTQGVSELGGVFVAEDALDEAIFLDFEETAPHLYTIKLDRTYSHNLSSLSLTTVVPDLEPISPRYETNSDIGDGSLYSFSDGSFWDDPGFGYVDITDGGEYLLADSIYLFDKDVNAILTRGISFLDVARFGLPTYYAEIQIDTHAVDNSWGTYIENAFLDGVDFYLDEDTTVTDRAMRAVVDAKALRDTIAVSLAPVRPVTMGDYLADDTTYGAWTSNPL